MKYRTWKKDSNSGLFLPKVTNKPSNAAELARSQAARFADTRNWVMSHPAVLLAIQRKIIDAVFSFGRMKMGTHGDRYAREAYQDYVALVTLCIFYTGRSIEEVANETPFEFPLKLTRRRMAFSESLPELFEIAAEYEQVHEVAKQAGKKVTAWRNPSVSEAQFQRILMEELSSCYKREGLTFPRTDELRNLVKKCNRKTPSSKIALDCVGLRRKKDSAVIKKMLVVVRDPARIYKSFSRQRKKRYLPPNIDEILKHISQTTG